VDPEAKSSFAEHIHKARCQKCPYNFPLSIPTRPIQEYDPEISQWLGGLSCPSCHESGTNFDFRCMTSVRESIYFVTCKACQHPFQEKAPMEAFE
jgi:hypothetical protein